MPDYRVIARVAKAHGKKGEVVTVPVHGLPSLMHEGLSVCVVPPRLKGPRWHRVLSCTSDGRGQRIALDGVADLGAAEALVGRSLLVSVEDLPDDFAYMDLDRLIGRHVEDPAYGDLGEIEEILQGPANDVWVIRGSEAGEILLPVIDAVVPSIPSAGSIEVHVPKGTIPEEGD
ncbi:MAG: ribosome maturation factor RimM [Atopobiaceae bacterium]